MPMTKPVSDTFTADRTMPAPKVEDGIETVKAQLASAAVLPRKIWETQFALASEILTFMGRRMQAQAEFCAELSRCREIGEAVEAQQDFARQASGAYADEAERLSVLTRKNMDAWSGRGTSDASGWADLQKAAA